MLLHTFELLFIDKIVANLYINTNHKQYLKFVRMQLIFVSVLSLKVFFFILFSSGSLVYTPNI